MGTIVYFTDENKDYYDPDACEIHIDGETTVINGIPKEILDYLILNHNIAISKNKILEELYKVDADLTPDDKSVKANMSTLRKKLGKYGHIIIKTINRNGYKYVGPLSAANSPENKQTGEHEKSAPEASVEVHNASESVDILKVSENVDARGTSADVEPASMPIVEEYPYLADLFDRLDKRIAELEQTFPTPDINTGTRSK